MLGIGKNKKSKNQKKSSAIAFVDYEHWFYASMNLWRMSPDTDKWRLEIEQYGIKDILVFADFSSPVISAELPKIRTITNTIIETRQPVGYKKNITDFIMLDYIYQTVANQPEIDTYILFTGDGHFQSVVKYLMQRCGKRVIVYGVRNAFSAGLKATADQTFELPTQAEEMQVYYKMLIKNFVYIADKEKIIPTFMGTVSAVAAKNNVPAEKIKQALSEMLNKGWCYRKELEIEINKTIKILAVNWEALVEAGLCTDVLIPSN